jgi:lysylphosphatidylglycerol synthetase-like protein (DUF2156 family)
VLFAFAELTPILMIVNYIIWLLVNIIGWVIDDLLPLTGNPDPAPVEVLKSITSHRLVIYAPPIIEMILLLQLFVISIADMSIITIVTFLVYIVWIMMFNYANSAAHNQTWCGLGKWLGGLTESGSGSGFAVVIEKVRKIGDASIRWYMNDVSK